MVGVKKGMATFEYDPLPEGGQTPTYHRVLQDVSGNRPSDLVARLTNLGWVCFGPTLTEDFRRKTKSHFTRTYRASHTTNEEPIDDLLKRFWVLDSMGIEEPTSQTFAPDEKAALDQAKKTKKKIDGQYEIGIPWRRVEPSFDNNYEMALSRLKVQEKSLMKKGPKIAPAYN